MATAAKAIPKLSTLREIPSRPWLSALLILSADLAALMLAAGFSAWLRGRFQREYELTSYWQLWPVLGIFISVYGLFGLYPGVVTCAVPELRGATGATTIVCLVVR